MCAKSKSGDRQTLGLKEKGGYIMYDVIRVIKAKPKFCFLIAVTYSIAKATTTVTICLLRVLPLSSKFCSSNTQSIHHKVSYFFIILSTGTHSFK